MGKRVQTISLMRLGDLKALIEGSSGYAVVTDEKDRPWGAFVTMDDFERLRALDEKSKKKEFPRRHGKTWEAWEDVLVRNQDLSVDEIAEKTERTEKAIWDRRRHLSMEDEG